MRKLLLTLLFVPVMASAQKQYYLPTADTSADEKDKPMIEVYLPKPEVANGCAVVLCPGGAMRWLSWESDVVKMASFLNEHGIAAIGLRYHLNKAPMPQGMKMPAMVDVTHPEAFPKADANPMHTPQGDSIICLAAMDAMTALHVVRDHAAEWNINKSKVGFLGFSAGGGVAIAATMLGMVAGKSKCRFCRSFFFCKNIWKFKKEFVYFFDKRSGKAERHLDESYI